MFYWQDVRYALRLLAKTPFFTILTVAVLAGGLAVSIFTFSFLHSAMRKPLPVPRSEGIVCLLSVTAGGETGYVDAWELAAMRPRITTLNDIGAFAGREFVVGLGDGLPRRSLQAVASEWNIFAVTGTRPMLGRAFRPEDQAHGAEPVVVLSEWAWRVVFASDRELLEKGKPVRLNGVPTRVVGVMPAGYGFPVAAEAWVPIRPELLAPGHAGQERVQAYARLAPGVDAEKAAAELTALLGSVRIEEGRRPEDPSRPVPTAMAVRSFPMAQIGEEGPLAFAVLNALAAFILLLACVNVTNLLLARANERVRETAVRLALGAPRGRLVMQNMWETILLCVAGGVLATGLAVWGLGAVDAWARAHLEGNLPFWWSWGFDRTVLLSAGAKGKRFALPNSRVLIHQPHGGAQGQAVDIEIQAKEILRYRKLIDEILAMHTGQSLEKISKDTDRDFIMTAEQAKEYGLIDEVIASRKITPELAAAAAGGS